MNENMTPANPGTLSAVDLVEKLEKLPDQVQERVSYIVQGAGLVYPGGRQG